MLLAGGAGILLSSPRHRALYFGDPPTSTPSAGAAPSAARPDAQARIRIPVTDRAPARLPAEGVPSGWTLKEFAGEAVMEVVRGDRGLAVRLRSERSSFALHRDALVDLAEYPVLSWSWKVTRLPPNGDVRDAARDDQAAQVYVIFPRWPSPKTASDVLGYVWDSRAPVGSRLAHPRAPNVRIIVLESGTARADVWVREERNVADDYAAMFGRRPPPVGKIALMIDSNDTRAAAEAQIGELTFSRGPSGKAEISTAVLR